MFFSLSSDIRCVISIIIFFERIQLWQQNAAADAPKRKSLRKKWLKKQQRRKSQRRNNFDTLDEKKSAFETFQRPVLFSHYLPNARIAAV